GTTCRCRTGGVRTPRCSPAVARATREPGLRPPPPRRHPSRCNEKKCSSSDCHERFVSGLHGSVGALDDIGSADQIDFVRTCRDLLDCERRISELLVLNRDVAGFLCAPHGHAAETRYRELEWLIRRTLDAYRLAEEVLRGAQQECFSSLLLELVRGRRL